MSESKPADLKTDDRVYWECELPWPLGTAEFIGALEKKMLRRLKLLKGGRPGKPTTDSRQSELTFGA